MAVTQTICHDCARRLGRLPALDPALLTATSYQLEKYVKHTAPSSSHLFNTIFSSPASANYANYIVTATSAGYVEVDSWNRTNIVLVASYQTGIALSSGKYSGPTEGVKVVLPHDRSKVHGFPVRIADLIAKPCSECGAPLPY